MNKFALLIMATIFTNMPIDHIQSNPNQKRLSYQGKHKQHGQRQFFKELLENLNKAITLEEVPLEIGIFIDEMYRAAWTGDTSIVEAMLKSDTIDVNYVLKLYPENPNRNVPLISVAIETVYSPNVALMIEYGSKDKPPLNVNAKTYLPLSDIPNDTGTPLEFAVQLRDAIDPNRQPEAYHYAQENVDLIKAAGGRM